MSLFLRSVEVGEIMVRLEMRSTRKSSGVHCSFGFGKHIFLIFILDFFFGASVLFWFPVALDILARDLVMIGLPGPGGTINWLSHSPCFHLSLTCSFPYGWDLSILA